METFISILFILFIGGIISLFIVKYVSNKNLNNLELQLFFTKLEDLPQIRDFAYDTLKNACVNEGIYFYETPDIIINKDCNNESNKAVGLYSYMKNMSLDQMHDLTTQNLKDWKELKNVYDSYNLYFPKIQINIESEYYKEFTICLTLAHELGHHMIHMNNEIQSEELADKYTYDIFKKYLPKCFIAISHLILQIRMGNNKPIIKDFNEYYNDYLQFRKNYPELKLPLLYNNL